MRSAIRVFGEVSITAGLVLLLFCAYLLWGTASYTARHQRELQEHLERELAAKRPRKLSKVELGKALALIRIPRLGDDYKFAIVEGVGFDELRRGPGHMPDTALPGQVGNFVLSGHRTTYKEPFNRLDEVRSGDEIVIDAREARYVYLVTDTDIVPPTEVEVAAPVPRQPDRTPTERFITLTTCHPRYSAAERLVVFGRLKSHQPRG